MRPRTIDAIVADIQDRASLSAGDTFVTEDRVLEYANQSYARLYGMLVQARGHVYYERQGSLTTTNATMYTLPEDFWQMRVVSINYGGFKRTIQPFMPKEGPRWSETAVPADIVIDYRYTPSPPRLGLGASQIVDGVAGWEEWIVLDATIKILAKEESDTTDLKQQRADLQMQIEQLAGDRDAGTADRVVDVHEQRDFGFTLGAPRYRITGPDVGSSLDRIEILWGPLPGIAFWP